MLKDFNTLIGMQIYTANDQIIINELVKES